MGYIGNIPAEKYSAFTKQDFSTSATTSYTLSQAVANENEIALFINFVRQEPTTAYTASGTSLTLTSATASSDDMYCVYLGKAVQTVNPPSGSVGSSQVAASIITGQTALGATPADTDELLISDAGTLKRVDFSYLKTGITMADQWRLSSNFTCNGNDQTVTGWEAADQAGSVSIGSAMTESSGVFTFPSTGLYWVHAFTSYAKNADRRYCGLNIKLTTNNSSYADIATGWGHIVVVASDDTFTNVTANSFVDVTDTTNVKVRFGGIAPSAITAMGSTTINLTCFTFIRLGDT